uniref:Uncharacterized protein n=1 Tax=Cacopsylla melanoneura TaxID=428564 RepID=A0A8D8YRM0_9HEMI
MISRLRERLRRCRPAYIAGSIFLTRGSIFTAHCKAYLSAILATPVFWVSQKSRPSLAKSLLTNGTSQFAIASPIASHSRFSCPVYLNSRQIHATVNTDEPTVSL